MERSALVLLERAEHAARERRLAAGLEAERRISAARAEAARIEEEAAVAAATAGAAARGAISAAADREIAALEPATAASFRPSLAAQAAARAFVVGALLGEAGSGEAGRTGPPGADAPGEAPCAEREG